MNFCVVQGIVVGEPRVTALASGETALTFDVQTIGDGGGIGRTSVPVEWKGPAKKLPKVSPDLAVAVTGSVARRFYRAQGSTQTRVYIKPFSIVLRQPSKQRRLIEDALAAALAERS